MNLKWRGVLEQFVLTSAVFLAFLLVFEDQIVVPNWLQVIGRLHPLLLHFPIVLLILLLSYEFFKFTRDSAPWQEIVEKWISDAWIAGAALTGLTTIFGLLLSKESGYAGETLFWHKWSAVTLFILFSGIYWIRNSSIYQQTSSRILIGIVSILLLSTGHFGAELTHGDGFVLAPFEQGKQIYLEDALVFDHMVNPILQNKCVSCHNPEKKKGRLDLSSKEGISKGGKSGPLFVTGKPEISLLLERIHLPLEDKKHMPVSGQPQLSDEEKMTLGLWIKGNATFTKKVLELPATDSLRIMGNKLFVSVNDESQNYDFSEASQETIDQLTNEYRTIAPLAKNSPALRVHIFNKNEFNSKKIEELIAIKQQIIFLSVAKMPVKDADLLTIAQFENLERLELNFSNISAKGLMALKTLSHLKSISLSGTQMTFQDLQMAMQEFKKLQTIYLWDTPLTQEDLNALSAKFKSVKVIGGFKDDGKNPLKLNPPELKNTSTIFDTEAPLTLFHTIKGVEIRYTMDGTPIDSVKSAIFDGKVKINTNTRIRARAFKAGWIGSEEAIFEYYKCAIKPDSVTVVLPLNRVHQANGPKSFFDRNLGTFSANAPAWANFWTGVRNNDMELNLNFKTPKTISTVSLRIMEELSTGIFPPQSIEIWGKTNPTGAFKRVHVMKIPVPKETRFHELYAIDVKFKPTNFSEMKIIAKPLEKIPQWHGAKDKRALLLVDEIFLN
ncbi:MAG: hypothetical protein RL246_1972 [Bacteroidota bacterium]|jgi:uncharacterized membrane protein